MFSAFSTAFGFVVNDLSDAELDRSAGVIRNPVSTGELSRGRCISVALLLLLVSLAALSRLSFRNRLLGMVVIFLYFTYSWIVRAKARPMLDVAYHGLCLAILATMGYTEYRPFDVDCLLGVSIVFLLSAMSQVLQEIRDYETDRNMIKTTVTSLGKRRSLVLCLAFLASAFFISLLLLSNEAVFNEEHVDKMLKEIQEKRLIMIALLLTALILGRIYAPLAWLEQVLKNVVIGAP